MVENKDYRRMMLVVIVGALFTCTEASVTNAIKRVQKQRLLNKVLTRTQVHNQLPSEFLKGLKRFGKITGHTHIDKVMIPSENDITMETLFPRFRVKRDGDGVLKSKFIKAGEIKSFNIRSNTVLADKILGQSIVADRVQVTKDFRRKMISKDKTRGSPPKPENKSTDSKKANDKTKSSTLMETSDKIGREKTDKSESKKPNMRSSKAKGSRKSISNKIKKTDDKKHLSTINKDSKRRPTTDKDNKKRQSTNDADKKPNDKDDKKRLSTNDIPSSIHKAQFIHGSSVDTKGIAFIRGNAKEATDRKSKVGKNIFGIDLTTGKQREYDKFIRERNKELKELFPKGFPLLAESQTGDVRRERLKKPTSTDDDADGLLKAKDIRSNSISALNTIADRIRADSIRSKTIDAKLIDMQKARKPKLSFFEQTVPLFTVKKKPDSKASLSSFLQPRRTRMKTFKVPTNLNNRVPVPSKFGLGEVSDHDPFAMAQIYTKEKSVNDFII